MNRSTQRRANSEQRTANSVVISMMLIGSQVLFAGPATAVWGEKPPTIPIPALSDVMTNKESFRVGPMDVQVTMFHTTLSTHDMRTYYQRQMPKHGWRSSAMPLQIPSEAQAHFPKGWEESLTGPEDVLYFTQHDQLAMIRIERSGSQTAVYINRLDSMEALQEEAKQPVPPGLNNNFHPVPATSHDPIMLPVFEDAQRLVSIGHPSDRSYMRMYQSTRASEEIVAYYRAEMAYAGWRLGHEDTRTQELTIPKALYALAPADVRDKDGSSETTALRFQKDSEMCTILVMEVPEMARQSFQTSFALECQRLGPRRVHSQQQPRSAWSPEQW